VAGGGSGGATGTGTGAGGSGGRAVFVGFVNLVPGFIKALCGWLTLTVCFAFGFGLLAGFGRVAPSPKLPSHEPVAVDGALVEGGSVAGFFGG
jgi:hypothetical protein